MSAETTEPLAPLQAALAIKYTLTPGIAVEHCLRQFAKRQIIGSRCSGCQRMIVPAESSCSRCGAEAGELFEMPQTGSISAFTACDGAVFALVRLDGADTDLLHVVLDADVEQLSHGQRVEAVWAEGELPESILAMSGFRIAAGEPPAASPRPFSGSDDVPADASGGMQVDARVDLHYEHAYGNYYGRLFDELKATRRIVGVRCPSCQAVLVPPRAMCEVCFVPTAQFEDVADFGTLRAFSVIHLAFEGQVREPPYVYAEITLDGASTRLIHVVDGIDVSTAHETLRPGMAVRAVWKQDSHTGTLDDIDHFTPIADD